MLLVTSDHVPFRLGGIQFGSPGCDAVSVFMVRYLKRLQDWQSYDPFLHFVLSLDDLSTAWRYIPADPATWI